MTIQTIEKNAQERMKKSIEALHAELSKVRTGRPQPNLLEHIKVECYGSLMPLNQLASVTVADHHTLMVTPWDKSTISAIEKAILQSDLGLNPANNGQALRVPLPALTEERRKELIKVVRAEAEKAKVAVRNIRREANNDLKDLLKEKQVSEDEERRSQETIQKLTDKFITEIDTVLAGKETELMTV